MRINHNIASLRALNQLEKSNGKLDKTLERLSSGLRINHAADDAAGLAITQKMDTQVRGLKQANRNAMDGISLIQTAEGALNEVHSMLQRIRELAVQVSNGTYDAADRTAVQDEVSQLQNEVQRISDDIEFNEMKLLNGDIDRRAFSTDESIADIVSMSDTVEAGDYTFEVLTAAKATADTGGLVNMFSTSGKSLVEGTLNINGEQIEIAKGDSTEEVFAQIRDLCSTVDVSCTLDSAPFGDNKRITLESNQYGPDELDVTGNKELLIGLGLDSDQFNPNAEPVYTNETNTVRDFAANTIDLGGAGTATVVINGVEVVIADGDDGQDVLDKLNSADVPGVEFASEFNGTTEYIKSFSSRPMTIVAKNDSTPATQELNDKLAEELKSLNATVDIADGAARSTATEAVDLVTTTPAAGSITVTIDSAVAVTVNVAIDLSVTAMTDKAGAEAVVEDINDALLTAGVTNTTALYDDDSESIVFYNNAGDKVSISATVPGDANDDALADVLGFKTSNVTYDTKIGTLGRDVQINTANLVYDDPDTTEIDGFPEGTTVSASGQDILFQSNDNFELRLVSGNATGEVTLNLLETGPLDLQIGANEGQFMEVRIQNLSPRALGITDINLSTAEGAQKAITTVDDAIQTISSVRSKLGAYQNRLEYTIANLDSASENMTSALSRILDADMAYEMSQFTQQNVIQQAGTSMLAQANQRPQSLLQLLQG